jgi:hypothetical protein
MSLMRIYDRLTVGDYFQAFSILASEWRTTLEEIFCQLTFNPSLTRQDKGVKFRRFRPSEALYHGSKPRM